MTRLRHSDFISLQLLLLESISVVLLNADDLGDTTRLLSAAAYGCIRIFTIKKQLKVYYYRLVIFFGMLTDRSRVI